MKYLILLVLIWISCSIMPRQQAPEFTAQAVMPDLSFKKISLSDYAGKFVVLLFYPFDFTYVCPTEITSFASKVEDFNSTYSHIIIGINTQVIALSVDSHFSHLAWRKADKQHGGLGAIDIPLVSDISKTIAKDYGVLVED